jgi:hydroxyacylglutathione hydrolase
MEINMPVSIKQIACLKDNYALLIHDPQSGATALIDAPDSAPILSALDDMGWTLTDILITHRHWDHTQGIADLQHRYPNAHLYLPAREYDQIKADGGIGVSEGDIIHIGSCAAQVIETPGHTIGHIVYWFENENILCAGDTLFSIGCGRVNETPMEIMWQSLCKLRSLPEETEVYCGHEYTLANARFALNVDANNLLLREHVTTVEHLRAQNLPSLPTSIALECAINPFLRADSADMRTALDMHDARDDEIFAHLRDLKNKA